MGVGRKGEARCIVEPPNAQTEMARDAALHRRHHLVKDKGPLAIGQPRRVLPAVELRLEGDVWPVLVAVGGEMQALRRSDERRVGKECVSTCRSRWSPCPYKKKN